ncbi:hypothetical protein HCN44_000142 [Aphidius gifuensis]|uniref:ABC transporter domain-containing protein n=1 Tax=Aphidius gifuensis TaxID=684658 RepID=A0A834XRG6_APHGI|nr:hypothetical protein HCN44_000142 [Aphidius gifuensis]
MLLTIAIFMYFHHETLQVLKNSLSLYKSNFSFIEMDWNKRPEVMSRLYTLQSKYYEYKSLKILKQCPINNVINNNNITSDDKKCILKFINDKLLLKYEDTIDDTLLELYNECSLEHLDLENDKSIDCFLDSAERKETIHIRYSPKIDDTKRLMTLFERCSFSKFIDLKIHSYFNKNISSVNILFEDDKSNDTNKIFKNGLQYDIFVLSMQPNEIDSSVINLIQSCIDKSYIKLQTNTSIIDEPEFSTKEYSYFDRFKFIYLQSMSWSYSTVTLLVILITYLVEMTYIVKEKTSGSNVLMSLNGVDNWLNLLSWLVTGVIWNMPLVVTIVLLLKYSWVSDVHLFLTNGNTIVVILLLLLHVIHLFCFGYHVASYFNEVSVSLGIISVTYIFKLVVKFMSNKNIDTNRFDIYLGLFIPNFLIEEIFDEIKYHEVQGVGIGFTNMFLIEFDRKPFEASIGMIMILSIFAAMFHFFMALYIHAILPDKYGVKCHPFGWFLNKNKTENSQIQLDSDELEQNEDFEKIPAGSLVAGVQIRGLEKNYNTGLIRKNEFHALKGVSMDFYHGEITALLGHNGAGKTTMMSILSGLIESSNGVVIINGKNILDDNVINDNVGLCPQVNITVPDLNVYQQVLFFAKLRGKNKTPAQIKDDVDNLISKVNLQDKKNCIPDQLSGGQKRRLCLAMAVIGDANVLIFDEPTSGLDAESKREVWDIILALKSDKTILISTHDMEEADILGDRIAIMHSGRLSSYGSSMFLKKYHGNNQVEVSLSLEPDCDTSKILESICDNVKILNQRNNTIVLAIPNTQSLPEVLDKLENTKKHLGITGISASIISLEQVFVKVTNEHDDNIDEKNNEINNDSKLFDKTTGLDYFMQTFWGYLMKKYAYAMKNPWSFILRLILPCLITASMLLYLLESSEPIDTTNLSLNNQSILFYKKWKDTEDKLISNEHITKRISDKEMIVTAKFHKSNRTFNINQLFYLNNESDEYFKIINGIYNTLLKIYSNNSDLNIRADKSDIVALAIKKAQHRNEERISYIRKIAILEFMIILTIIFLSFYVTEPLGERTTGIKLLQDMTGASKILYWATMFIVDFVHYTITILLLLTSLILVDNILNTQLYNFENIPVLLLLFLAFGITGLPSVYVVSLFKISKLASKFFLIVLPLGISLLCEIFYGLLYKEYQDKNQPVPSVLILANIFLLIPQVNFCYSIIHFHWIIYNNAIYLINPNDRIIEPYWSFKKYGQLLSLPYCLIIFVISLIIFIAIMIIVEQKLITKIIRKIRKNNLSISTIETDELVQKETAIVSERIEKHLTKIADDDEDNENVFLAHELKKNYGNLQAVKGISFRVKTRECFGLLGVNGAGKSTTFKMLTGEESPHHGMMYLKQTGMHENHRKYLSQMGYCPQHDALIEPLNAWDHLYLFARLRGIPESQIKLSVEGWIKQLNLGACASRPSHTYSGGNKRRLNIALALIGRPSLILMDEPTTGVDPAARRSLWRTLNYCQNSGQSMILTSHSMEECEILCNRLVIMVNGKLVCVGAVQELKQRFGAGYNIHIKISHVSTAEDVQQIKFTIESTIICQKMDENSGFLGYHVTDPCATWTVMYGMMNTLKNNYKCIEDFTVLSSTLEQLFIQFARAENHHHENLP